MARARPKRKFTEQGIGAVRSEPEDESRPLGMRDTVPAPPSVPNASASGTSSSTGMQSGAQRRFTLDGFASSALTPAPAPRIAEPPSSAPISAPPVSAPPASGGRYSSVGATEDASLSSKPRLADRARI